VSARRWIMAIWRRAGAVMPASASSPRMPFPEWIRPHLPLCTSPPGATRHA
jgi:hypothetical protein